MAHVFGFMTLFIVCFRSIHPSHGESGPWRNPVSTCGCAYDVPWLHIRRRISTTSECRYTFWSSCRDSRWRQRARGRYWHHKAGDRRDTKGEQGGWRRDRNLPWRWPMGAAEAMKSALLTVIATPSAPISNVSNWIYSVLLILLYHLRENKLAKAGRISLYGNGDEVNVYYGINTAIYSRACDTMFFYQNFLGGRSFRDSLFDILQGRCRHHSKYQICKTFGHLWQLVYALCLSQYAQTFVLDGLVTKTSDPYYSGHRYLLTNFYRHLQIRLLAKMIRFGKWRFKRMARWGRAVSGLLFVARLF